MSTSEKLELVEPENTQLSVRKQCELLQLNRSTYYYPRKPLVSEEDKRVMDLIDQIYTKCPFYGSRKIGKELGRQGELVNRKRVQRLMGIMGIEAIRPKHWTSKPKKGHEIFPYLLKGVKIAKPDQVWSVDITYIRLKKEWMYLVAILDWYTRYVLSWKLSDSMAVEFCVAALEDALGQSQPDIHNSDQGSQFTSEAYLNVLKTWPRIQISMDGRGRAYDNIFIERFWRTLKYEEVYLKEYTTPREVRQSIGEYIQFYNNDRIHSALGYQTPAEKYFG